MKVPIDGDSLVYTIGFACQQNIWQACDPEEGIVYYENEKKNMVLGFIEDNPDLGTLDVSCRIVISPVTHAFHTIKLVIQKICQRAKANSYKVYLTGEGNFREQIATIMGYKHNRIGKPKPELYQEIRDYLINVHKATLVNGMEADDALSIVYTRSVAGVPTNVSLDPNHEVLKYPEEMIIAAIDKDLRNIPGKHINFDKRVAENDEYKFIIVTEEEGRRSFWKQVLTGDSSDNILGIPKMGPKKSDVILEGCVTEENYFDAVYTAYKNKFGTEPFEYFRYDAYEDTTASYSKRVLKPKDKIMPEQRLTGTALIFLLENARLLWMLRKPISADGSHWWMPPYSFEQIAEMDATKVVGQEETAGIEAALKSIPDGVELGIPYSEGRGKWFYITQVGEYPIKSGPFGTKKKAVADMKEPRPGPFDDEGAVTTIIPNTDDVSVQNDVSTEGGPTTITLPAKQAGQVIEVVTDDDLVTEPENNSSEETRPEILSDYTHSEKEVTESIKEAQKFDEKNTTSDVAPYWDMEF